MMKPRDLFLQPAENTFMAAIGKAKVFDHVIARIAEMRELGVPPTERIVTRAFAEKAQSDEHVQALLEEMQKSGVHLTESILAAGRRKAGIFSRCPAL